MGYSTNAPQRMRPRGRSGGDEEALDYPTSSAQSDVVWTHAFDATSEVTQFAVDQGAEGEGVPLRIVERRGIRWLEQTILGDTLAAEATIPASGTTTLTITDGTYWDSPHLAFPFRVVISTAYPDATPRKLLLNVTAYDSAAKMLTVEPYTFVGNGFVSAPQSYAAGSIVGQDCDSWTRPFSALPSTENGRLVDDAAAAGAVPVRSRLAANANSVPFDTTPYLWHYGYYAHPDVQARHANWTPYRTVSGAQQTLTTRGPINGAAAKYSLFDGSEFWLDFVVELDSRFYLNTSQPDEDAPDGENMSAMKWVSLDTETSVLHQILFGHSSEDRYSLPGTNMSPLVMLTNKASSRIGYDDWARTNPNDSHQLGGAWHVSPGYARLVANPNPATSGWPTPDGKLAWEIPTDAPVAFAIRVRPGHSQAADSQLEVRKAEITSGSYANVWTTVFSATDVKLNFANSGAQSPSDSTNVYPDAAVTWPTIPLFDTLPGYQAITLMGYSNVRQGAFPRPMRRSFRRWLSRVTLRRSAPPPPLSLALPSWVPGTANTWTTVTATNSLNSTIPAYYLPTNPARAFNEFSSSVLNPYWGRYGAVFGHGGGHSSSNYDGTWCMDLSYSGITFRRLVAPTHFFTDPNNQATWTDENRYRNFGSSAYLPGGGYPQAEATEDWVEPIQYGSTTRTGHPAAVHSYQSLAVIGPAHGGAAHGTLVQPGKSFAMFSGLWGAASCHRMDLSTATGATDSYSWARWSGSTPVVWNDAAFNSCFVGKQNRVYVGNIKTSHSPRWFDLTTGQYDTSGTGTAWRRSVGGAGAALIYVEERDLLLFVVSNPESGANLVVDYMQVRTTDTNPSWVQANLSPSISYPTNSGTQTVVATWCGDNQRLICGNVYGDPNCVYEIAIPPVLTDAWPTERVEFTAPSGFSWPGSLWPLGWHYNPKIKACLSIPYPTDGAQETVFVYRPRGV